MGKRYTITLTDETVVTIESVGDDVRVRVEGQGAAVLSYDFSETHNPVVVTETATRTDEYGELLTAADDVLTVWRRGSIPGITTMRQLGDAVDAIRGYTVEEYRDETERR